MKTAGRALVLSLLLIVPGCQTTRAVSCFLFGGLVNGVLGSDESLSEQADREQDEQEWKQYWRENPNVNPKMTEAFSGE